MIDVHAQMHGVLSNGRLFSASIMGALALFTTAALMADPACAGSDWSGAFSISPTNQPDPTRGLQLNDVASNSLGLTLSARDQFSYSNGGGVTIGGAVMSGGRWSAPFTVSGATGFCMTPRVAVGADETMAVSWICQDAATQPAPLRKIQVAVRTAGSEAW